MPLTKETAGALVDAREAGAHAAEREALRARIDRDLGIKAECPERGAGVSL